MRFLQMLSTLKPMRRLRVEFQPEAVAELRAIFESVMEIAGSVRVARGSTERKGSVLRFHNIDYANYG